MEQGNAPQSPAPAANQRIPFSLAYLLAVIAGAAANSYIFSLLVKHFVEPMLDSSVLLAISIFFGIMFAGGCNVTAQTLARWVNRRNVLDRIIFFMLVTLFGDVVMVLCVPFIVRQFQ